MLQTIRLLLQFLFLVVFFGLMALGKTQIWIAIILISIILAAFFGRFYCGWLCPINTLIRPVRWIADKLKWTKRDVPAVFKTKTPKYIAFGLFLIGLGYTIFTMTQGRKFPLPLIIIPLALITTLFINEKTWHTYLCPWGTLLSFTGRFSKYRIEAAKCSGCALCAKACPADAVMVDKKKGTVGNPKDCLVCFECTDKCPPKRMSYTNQKSGSL